MALSGLTCLIAVVAAWQRRQRGVGRENGIPWRNGIPRLASVPWMEGSAWSGCPKNAARPVWGATLRGGTSQGQGQAPVRRTFDTADWTLPTVA